MKRRIQINKAQRMMGDLEWSYAERQIFAEVLSGAQGRCEVKYIPNVPVYAIYETFVRKIAPIMERDETFMMESNYDENSFTFRWERAVINA